jgi:hypothetical protein
MMDPGTTISLASVVAGRVVPAVVHGAAEAVGSFADLLRDALPNSLSGSGLSSKPPELSEQGSLVQLEVQREQLHGDIQQWVRDIVELFAANGIDLSQRCELTDDGRGHPVEVGGHVQRDRIEAVLTETPSLSRQFATLSSRHATLNGEPLRIEL